MQISRHEVRLAGDHLLVKNAHDANSTGDNAIENHMLALFMALEPWTDGTAHSTDPGILRHKLKTLLQCRNGTGSLFTALFLNGVTSDAADVGERFPRNSKPGQDLRPFRYSIF